MGQFCYLAGAIIIRISIHRAFLLFDEATQVSVPPWVCCIAIGQRDKVGGWEERVVVGQRAVLGGYF